MKPALLLSLLAAALCSAGEPECTPNALNAPEAHYPCVSSDNTATFKIKAPDAQKVSISMGGKVYDMSKGGDGIWTVTTAALPVGFHYYTVHVDGAVVADPWARTYFGGGWYNSGDRLLLFQQPDRASRHGAGNFSASTVPVGSSARSIAVGDFNADGNRDLVVALLYQGLVVLSGDGTGRFTPASAAIPLTQPASIALADLNGDRNLHLAVASQSGGLTLLTGDGTGRFNAGAPILAGMTPISVAVGDFNGYSLPDFAVASPNDGTFSILTQNASTPLWTLYKVHDACPVPNCSLTLLSDNGVVAGPDIAVYPDTGYINFFERTGQHFYPFSINRAGVIAGGTDSFSLDLRALAWVPGENAFLDLDTVFGWTHGRAEYVNDRNQIVGEPLPGVVTGVVQVLPLSRVAAVTNNGIVVGNDIADRGILYSPGIGIAYVANSLGHGAFNSAGQVLNSAPVIDKFLTVGSGVTSLPSPSSPFNTVSFNDVGQSVGFVPSGQTSAASIYTASGGLVPLDTLLPAGTGSTLNYGVAINNTGQILASGTLHGVPSFALLTPYMQGTTAPSPATAQRHPERRVACEGLTFNARTLCSDAPARSAWRAL